MTSEQKHFIQHLNERYYFELDRKEKLNAKINSPMTVIIVVIGVIAFFVQSSGGFGSDMLAISLHVLDVPHFSHKSQTQLFFH